MNEEIASMFVAALVVMIPIVAILTHHQRKMAEMIHGRAKEQEGKAAQSQDILVHELMRLREQVTTQALQIEDLRQELSTRGSTASTVAQAEAWDTERLS